MTILTHKNIVNTFMVPKVLKVRLDFFFLYTLCTKFDCLYFILPFIKKIVLEVRPL